MEEITKIHCPHSEQKHFLKGQLKQILDSSKVTITRHTHLHFVCGSTKQELNIKKTL